MVDRENNIKWVAIIVSIFIAFGGIVYGISERNVNAVLVEVKVAQKEQANRIQKLEEIMTRNTVIWEFIQKELKDIREIVSRRPEVK